MKRYFTRLILALLFFPIPLAAQSLNLPEGLGISNQLEYSYDKDKKQEIFENWLNLDYRSGNFSAGIRFDIFQPNDPNPLISRGKEKYADISYKYISYVLGKGRERLKLTAGNFYANFGRGMLLKSYEDRNLRVDNNLLGVKLEGRYAGFNITALTGMAENSKAERKDVLHALDIEYRGIKKLKLGASYVSNQPEYDELAATSLTSVRIEPSIWNFDIYTEFGIKQNSDIKSSAFDGSEDIVGKAFYSNLSFYLGAFSLVGEYKIYDNYTLLSYDGTIVYNNPPALRKDFTYILLNRHPSPLDQNNEKGYKFELGYELDDETSFNIEYAETRTLGPNSYYQRIAGNSQGEQTQLKEIYFQADRYWSDSYKTILAAAFNEELATNTESMTFILDNYFYSDDIYTYRIVFEHQHTTNKITEEEYYDNILMLEFQRSPDLSLAFVSEIKTYEPRPGDVIRKFWNYFMIGYNIWENTDLSLLIGSRQAGNICIGGICRYEPEFGGVELKMTTRL